jgi:hypothetical protein
MRWSQMSEWHDGEIEIALMANRGIGDLIRGKYIEGRWLGEADRNRFGLPVISPAVGLAV